MEKQWEDRTVGGTSCRAPVRNIRESENYGRHLLQGEFFRDSQWTEGIWFPDGKYAGLDVNIRDRSLDLAEVTNDAT